MAELSDKDYIRIEGDITRQYGGNQGWFDGKSDDYRIRHLFHGGCGVISATDVIIYTSRRRRAPVQGLCGFGRSQTIDIPGYLDMASGTSRYITPKPLEFLPKVMTNGTGTIGVFPKDFTNGITRLAADRAGLLIKAYFIKASDRAALEAAVERSLAADSPVPLKIGFGKGVTLFTEDFTPNQKLIRWHWVTVTGSFIREDKKWLTVSSWGKKYFIMLDNYFENTGPYGGAVITGL